MLLVAFLLGLLLGYVLWYKWQRLYNEMNAEHNRLKGKHVELEKEHASLRYRLEESEKDNTSQRRKVMLLEGDVTGLRFRLDKCESDMAAAAAVAATSGKSAMGAVADISSTGKKDDLKKIEGIGPKIEKLCNEIGIFSFAELAASPVERLQEMLDAAGPAYKIADPSSWAEQAALADGGKWDELKEFQNFLNAGRRTPDA